MRKAFKVSLSGKMVVGRLVNDQCIRHIRVEAYLGGPVGRPLPVHPQEA